MLEVITILIGLYLSGVVVSFIMLHKEVKSIYIPINRFDLTKKVFKNTWKFYLTSWYGAGLIAIKNNLKK